MTELIKGQKTKVFDACMLPYFEVLYNLHLHYRDPSLMDCGNSGLTLALLIYTYRSELMCILNNPTTTITTILLHSMINRPGQIMFILWMVWVFIYGPFPRVTVLLHFDKRLPCLLYAFITRTFKSDSISKRGLFTIHYPFHCQRQLWLNQQNF